MANGFWAAAVSFEAFILYPCYGVLDFTSNLSQSVLTDGPNQVVRCVLLASAGLWCLLARCINLLC